MGLKTKGILRVASTQNFDDFKGFSVLNRFSKTLTADIACTYLDSDLTVIAAMHPRTPRVSRSPPSENRARVANPSALKGVNERSLLASWNQGYTRWMSMKTERANSRQNKPNTCETGRIN